MTYLCCPCCAAPEEIVVGIPVDSAVIAFPPSMPRGVCLTISFLSSCALRVGVVSVEGSLTESVYSAADEQPLPSAPPLPLTVRVGILVDTFVLTSSSRNLLASGIVDVYRVASVRARASSCTSRPKATSRCSVILDKLIALVLYRFVR